MNARLTAELSRIGAGHHLEFLDGIRRLLGPRQSVQRDRTDDPINVVFVVIGRLPVGGNRFVEIVRLRVARRPDVHTRGKQRQIQEVAPVQREVDDGLALYDLASR